MLALERATRLRWIGWMILAPCLMMIVSSLVVMVVAPPAPIPEMIAGIVVFLAVAGAGAALIYLGARGTRAIQHDLESRAPVILAGYLRIDKNAAWTVAWIAIPLAIALRGGRPDHARRPGVGGAAPRWLAVGRARRACSAWRAAYAVWRALTLRRQIGWLCESRPASGDPETPRW